MRFTKRKRVKNIYGKLTPTSVGPLIVYKSVKKVND